MKLTARFAGLQAIVLDAVLPLWSSGKLFRQSQLQQAVVRILTHMSNAPAVPAAVAAPPAPQQPAFSQTTVQRIVEMGFLAARAEQALRRVCSLARQAASHMHEMDMGNRGAGCGFQARKVLYVRQAWACSSEQPVLLSSVCCEQACMVHLKTKLHARGPVHRRQRCLAAQPGCWLIPSWACRLHRTASSWPWSGWMRTQRCLQTRRPPRRRLRQLQARPTFQTAPELALDAVQADYAWQLPMSAANRALQGVPVSCAG